MHVKVLILYDIPVNEHLQHVYIFALIWFLHRRLVEHQKFKYHFELWRWLACFRIDNEELDE